MYKHDFSYFLDNDTEEFKKAADNYMKKIKTKKQARDMLVKIGTHKLDGRLTREYGGRQDMIISKKHPQYKEYLKFKKKHGFSPDEAWNLDVTIAKFIFPRLKCLKKQVDSYPKEVLSLNEWKLIIDKMIFAFKRIAKEKHIIGRNSALDNKKIEEGLYLFRKYYFNLWD